MNKPTIAKALFISSLCLMPLGGIVGVITAVHLIDFARYGSIAMLQHGITGALWTFGLMTFGHYANVLGWKLLGGKKHG